jgi:predicted nucleotidyltransferase
MITEGSGKQVNRDEVLITLAEHREELQRRYGVKSLALFGSLARNEATDTSDIDVLVEFEETVTLFDLVALQLDLERILGVSKVDVVMRDSIYPQIKETILSEAIDVRQKEFESTR